MNTLIRRVFLISIFSAVIWVAFGFVEFSQGDNLFEPLDDPPRLEGLEPLERLERLQQLEQLERLERLARERERLEQQLEWLEQEIQRRNKERARQISHLLLFLFGSFVVIFLAILVLKPEQKQKIQSHVMATAHFFVTRQGVIILAVVHVWLFMALLFYLLS